MADKDLIYMQYAIRLAKQARGTTGKNPAVGCVVVQNNQVVSIGKTGFNGRPHAEESCNIPPGSTVYVTLEPCAHKASHDNLSCTDRLLKAGIRRVVINQLDPDPRTAGKSVAALKTANINVKVMGLTDLYQGFKNRLTINRPQISLKIASSLDGCIALPCGKSKWITGETARAHTHLLRKQHDGILVGMNTVLFDKPKLTCRLPGLESFSPKAFTINTKQPNLDTIPEQQSIQIIDITKQPNDYYSALQNIATYGINTLLVEGGGKLAAALISAKLVDKIYWYHAPILLGHTGKPAIAMLEQPKLERDYKIIDQKRWQNGDILSVLEVM